MEHLVDPAIALARSWAAGVPVSPRRTAPDVSRREHRTTRRLAQLVADPSGLGFALTFVDRVTRPDDRRVAARELARAVRVGPAPDFITGADRLLLKAGVIAPLAPWPAVPLAKARMRGLVGHLVVDSAPANLRRFLRRARRDGYRTNLNLLGEAVLGDDEAARRAAGVARLLRTPGVDTVSVKVSSLVSQLSTWNHGGSVERIVERLTPLAAVAGRTGRTIALDMEEYRDLELTLDAFEATVLCPDLLGVDVTIALQAYLPDVDDALARVVRIGQDRCRAGGHDVKVRLVKGANLSMERVDAALHGWRQAPYSTKAEVDASYVRVLDRFVRPESTRAVRIGVAGHNLYHLALATLLARERGVEDRLEIEMLHGMAPLQAAAVLADTGSVLLYTPVVARQDFDVAIAYLTRRLEEAAAPQNFLHALVGADPDLDAVERAFVASVEQREMPSTRPSRARGRPRVSGGGMPDDAQDWPDAQNRPDHFENTPDSDPTDPAVRSEVHRALVSAFERPELAPTYPFLRHGHEVDDVVRRARAAQPAWAARTTRDRAHVLRAAAAELQDARFELIGVMAAEAGKTVAEADPELSEAIDFANYAAYLAVCSLNRPDAVFSPVEASLVVPPWNFPVAIPFSGVFAALAAGSSVVMKPAPQTRGCAEVAARAVHRAFDALDVPRDLFQLVHTDEGDVGRRLVTHEGFGRLVLTGGLETAELFLEWRPDLPLIGETSGKNAIVVTPAADLDLAVADIVRSAFGHAGQKCSAASLVITVGSLGESTRLRDQLLDAVDSLRVAMPSDLGSTVGPLIEPPSGKLLRALSALEPGERWLIQPRRLDDAGRLWRPGVRDGVRPGSFFHRTECFGPVLGLMHATDLDQAIDWQNDTGFGLTGGIHSLDDTEIEAWLERVEVGNAYVNRHITGAVVRRQPFGGWNRSVIGPGAKPGGPSYVAQFGTWEDSPRVAALPPDEWLSGAVASDTRAWAEEFGLEHDPSALGVESNVFRYRPVPRLTIRLGEVAAEHHVRRVLHLAATARVPVIVSDWREESDAEFAARIVAGAVSGRIRVIGGGVGLRAAAARRVGDVTLLDQPVLFDGRREGLTVLREQSISRTLHRFGHVEADTIGPSSLK
jgi:RHH-type proline utilization regulon transcriptional repressor/proline dehydrogenase/delta 1-pyrroline-5-carboxylate dehydrogenase